MIATVAALSVAPVMTAEVRSVPDVAGCRDIPRHRRRFCASSPAGSTMLCTSPAAVSLSQVICGHTHLCFSEDGSWFEGHLITSTDESQYGLVGRRVEDEPFSTDDGGVMYDLTVVDHEDAETYTVPSVSLTSCGSLCSLTAPAFRFAAQAAFRGQKADMLIQRYLTPRLVGKNLKVYAGQLSVDLDRIKVQDTSLKAKMWYM